jgi:hypothetical protein
MGSSQEIEVPKSGNTQPLHPVFTDIKTQLRLQLDALQNIQDYLKSLTGTLQDTLQYIRLTAKTPEILEEIEAFLKKHGTGSIKATFSSETQTQTQSNPQPKPKSKTTTSTNTNTNTNTNTSNDNETQVIEGTIEAATPKALLIKLLNGIDVWFPRSTIHNTYNDAMQDQKQTFEIDTWILKKNEVI